MINYSIFIYFIVAIGIIWTTSLSFIEKKKILLFLPFLVFGIINCFLGAFVFLEFYNIIIFTSIDVTYAVLLIWVFMIIRRKEELDDIC